MADNQNPGDLNALFDQFKREVFADLNAVQVGIIESFSPTDQTATVRLAMKHVVSVAPDGTRTLEERPLLLACPVLILSGGGGRLTMPIGAGDECLVLFCDREIDNWFAAGGVQAPTTSRTHDLSDALAIVGIRSLQRALTDYFLDGIELAHGGTSLRISAAGAVSSGPLVAPTLHAGNGATGTYNVVQVVDGIVVGGA